ncbi:hypothetical protein CARUB_v10011732mg [Capsella rubella]|uniref:Uncharacterized protein n=1 Tax=Capsella rubella TaxID=81985 RepID=R0IPI6_9BRAS|nr:hypothetical protein CARUB_v10011732mg [Capsella rubella]
MKTHRKLLLGLSVFFSPGTKITLPPEAEQHITSGGTKMTIPPIPKAKQHITLTGSKMTIPPEAKQHIASHNNKRKRVRSDDPDYDPVLDKLKPVFQACGSSGSQMTSSQSQRNTQQV